MYHQIQMLAGKIQYLLLADKAGGEAVVAPQEGDSGGDNISFMLILLAFMVFMLMFSGKGAKKRKQKRNQMIMSISKYTEVVTLGGICGTVVDIETVAEEDDADPVPTHFLLELDANSGSRLRVVAEAVGRVVENTDEESES